MRVVLLAILTLGVVTVRADQVIQAEAVLVPQMFQDDAGYASCGVRVIIASTAISTVGASVSGAEFTLMLATRPKLGGMFKAGGMRCPAPCNGPESVTYIHGDNYRLSSIKDGVPLKLLKTFPADSPAFTMAVTDAVAAADFLMKIVTGEGMQFAYMPAGSDVRQAYTFVAAPMSKEENASFQACMNGALKQ